MSMLDVFPSDMRTPSVASGMLHAGIVVLALVGLPLFEKQKPIEPEPMIVDFEEIAEKAKSPTVGAVQPATRAPVAKEPTPAPPPTASEKPPSPPKPEPPKPEEQAKASPPQPAATPMPAKQPEPPKPDDAEALVKPKEVVPPKPEPPKPTPTPKPPEVKKPDPPKPEPPKAVEKPKPPQPQPNPSKSADDIINALVNKTPQPQPHKPVQEAPKPAPPTRVATQAPNFAQRLTTSENAAIADRIRPCWNVNAGARDARAQLVEVEAQMQPDGTVLSARLVASARMSDPIYRAFADSALRAVLNPRCQPLPIPSGKYDAMRTLTIEFDPSNL